VYLTPFVARKALLWEAARRGFTTVQPGPELPEHKPQNKFQENETATDLFGDLSVVKTSFARQSTNFRRQP